MTTYVFKNDSWWDDNGCDCCEPTHMECYNFVGVDEYDYLEECSEKIPYSCHDGVDMKIAILSIFYGYDEELLWDNEGDIDDLVAKHSIEIEII